MVLTVLFSLALFSLLPLSIWVINSFDFPWLFLGVFGLIIVGYALLWPYRLLFLGLLVVLGVSGALYSHGDLLFSLLFFLVPYGVACVAIAYRVAERLSPVEWVEPEYHDVEPEAYGEQVSLEPGRPRLNPYADSRPVLLRREEKPAIEEAREAQRKEEDPCGGDQLIDLLLEKDTEDPEVEKKLREYMECRTRYFIEHFEEYEKRTGIKVDSVKRSEN